MPGSSGTTKQHPNSSCVVSLVQSCVSARTQLWETNLSIHDTLTWGPAQGGGKRSLKALQSPKEVNFLSTSWACFLIALVSQEIHVTTSLDQVGVWFIVVRVCFMFLKSVALNSFKKETCRCLRVLLWLWVPSWQLHFLSISRRFTLRGLEFQPRGSEHSPPTDSQAVPWYPRQILLRRHPHRIKPQTPNTHTRNPLPTHTTPNLLHYVAEKALGDPGMTIAHT